MEESMLTDRGPMLPRQQQMIFISYTDPIEDLSA